MHSMLHKQHCFHTVGKIFLIPDLHLLLNVIFFRPGEIKTGHPSPLPFIHCRVLRGAEGTATGEEVGFTLDKWPVHLSTDL